jgi:ABC-type Mn2+/Zn2+ transport system permease subunit
VRDWLLDPYRYEFMRHALAAAVLVGVAAPVVGVWIVLRRIAYLGDAMSHSLLAGVVGAYPVGWSIAGGALVAGLVMAGLVSLLVAHPRLREDAVIGVAETALFAAAGGLTLSYHLGSPPGATVALCGVAALAVTAVASLTRCRRRAPVVMAVDR